MLKTGLILVLLTCSLGAHSECVEYRKIHGLIHLKNKTWELTHVNKKSEKFCQALPLPVQPNLEVTLTKGKDTFSTKIFRPLVGHWDDTTPDKQFTGGQYDITYLPIDTFVPAWFKGSKIVVKEFPSQKVIIEGKL